MNVLSGDMNHAYCGDDIIEWCNEYVSQTKDATKARIARHLLKNYIIKPDHYYYLYSYTFCGTHKRFLIRNVLKVKWKTWQGA